MRPRHLLPLLALVLLPVAVGLLLVPGPSPKRPTTTLPLSQLSLELVGATNRSAKKECGTIRHYTGYPAGATIKFRGRVSPPPPGHRWKVAVKLKACVAGQFRSAGDVRAKVHRDGTFKGSFLSPVPGSYFARAALKLNGQTLARSDKRYFETR